MAASHPEFNVATTGDEVVSAFADRVKGRIFVVTGPSPKGIGASTAIALAKAHPAVLVLAGRTPASFQSIADEIKTIDAGIKVVLLPLDLGSLASVRAAAKELLAHADVPHIDVLINNAGIMATPFSKTADGIESQFGVNHVGHFLFTNLLLPKLKKSAEPLVVNVSSSGHRYFKGDLSDVNWEKTPYNLWSAYGLAKASNILFSVSLTQRGIKSIAIHPGWVGTDLGRNLTPETLNELIALVKSTPDMEPMGTAPKSIEVGCSTTLVAALDPKVPGGTYLSDCQVLAAAAPAADKGNAEKLWELSNKLTGESFP